MYPIVFLLSYSKVYEVNGVHGNEPQTFTQDKAGKDNWANIGSAY